MAFPSLGMVLAAIFMGYIAHSMYTMYRLYNPEECKSMSCLQPAWQNKGDLKHQLAVIVSTEKAAERLQKGKHQVVLNVEDFDIYESSELDLDKMSLPLSVRRNGSLYLHVYLSSRPPHADPKDPLELEKTSSVSSHSVKVTRYAVPKPEAMSLIGGEKKTLLEKKLSDSPYTHLPHTVSLCIMSSPHSLDTSQLPHELVPHLRLTPRDRKYIPIVFINEAAIMAKDLTHISPNTSSFQMKAAISPISMGKLRFLKIVANALENMHQFGLAEQDTDGVKGIFFDTSIYLLLTTILVSALHLIFDVMAFKNDVHFWRNLENFEGISMRAIAWRALSQIVILLYLYDNDTSRIILFTNVVSTVIEFWKLSKAFKVGIVWRSWFSIKLEFGSVSDAEKKTDEIDSQGMKLLSYILWPLCVGGAIYSLYYQPQKSWYSWSINSLANGVYAFGFLLMLPQLFLNYKLKSVAHLPWRVFTYKAFNTFIDDLFAFIIHMPTAHRVACFRDDAVFIIFLYQRWLYPVDKRRRNEFGESFEGEPTKQDLKLKESKKKK